MATKNLPVKRDPLKREFGDTTVGAGMALAEALGGAKLARATGLLMSCAEAATLKRIRDEKLYRGVPLEALAAVGRHPKPGLAEGPCKTFAEFCRAIGYSTQRVYERIAQYEAFGEELAALDQFGLPRSMLRLAAKAGGDGQAKLVALAKDPKADRGALVSEIRRHGREAAALREDRDELAGEAAKLRKRLERGKDQLRKLEEKLAGLKKELERWRAGTAMPEEDEEALKEFGLQAAKVQGFFSMLRAIRWRKDDPLPALLASLAADEALEYADEVLSTHGAPPADARQRKAFKRHAEAAREISADLFARAAKTGKKTRK